MLGHDITKSIFSDKAFQSYSFGWKIYWTNFHIFKIFIFNFFQQFFLFNKWQMWWMLSPRKTPCSKKSWLCACSWILSSMFKSLVISLVYLTNQLKPIFTLKYTHSAFCLWKVSTVTSKQLSTRQCSNAIVLLCTTATKRVQSLIRRLALTNFKSI